MSTKYDSTAVIRVLGAGNGAGGGPLPVALTPAASPLLFGAEEMRESDLVQVTFEGRLDEVGLRARALLVRDLRYHPAALRVLTVAGRLIRSGRRRPTVLCVGTIVASPRFGGRSHSKVDGKGRW